MHKDTKRLYDCLTINSNQLDSSLPFALLGLSAESRVLLELLHDRDLILRCLLSDILFKTQDEDVPNAETSAYVNLKPTKKNDRKKL